MSKKVFITLALLAGLAVIITVPDVLNALLAFIFIGIIPGTDISLPFWAMGIFIIVVASAAVLWLSSQSLYIGDRSYQQKEAKAAAREYVLEKVAKPAAKKTVGSTIKPARRRTKQAYRVVTS